MAPKKPDQTIRDKAKRRFLEESLDLDTENIDVQKLVQELRIHQIELEIQNEALRQAQQQLGELIEQYNDLYDFAPVGYLLLDKNTLIRRLNLTAATLLGVARDKLIDRPLGTRIPLAYHAALNQQVRSVLTHEAPPPCDLEIDRPDGSRLWVTLSSSLDVSAKEPLCRVTLTDVSALKHTEQQLRDSQATLQDVLQTTPVGIGMASQRVLVWSNERLAQMTGYSRAELVGMPARILYASEADYERIGQTQYPALSQGSTAVETRWRCKDGRVIDILLTLTAMERSDPTRAVVFAALDISERNEALAALREREETYRLLADNTVDCIWLTDRDLRFIYINPAIHSMLGYTPEEWLGSRLTEHCPASDSEKIEALLAAEITRRDAAGGLTLETMLTHKNGRRVAVEIKGSAIFDDDHKPVRLQGVTRDISERKQAEQEIRKFKMLAESAAYGVLIADLKGTITYTNAAFAAMHGYEPEELIGRSLSVLQPEGICNPLDPAGSERYEYAQSEARELTHLRRDGTLLAVLLNCTLVRDAEGAPSFLAVTATDITEFKSLEAQLRQAQKMEAIGQLAGGVAHDFNNLLMVILNRADLIQDALPPFSIYHDDLREIIDAAMRGAALTRQLLAFSSRQYLTIKSLDINTVIRMVEKLLKRLIGEDIQLDMRLDPEPCPVAADAGQLEQVILNLAVNARDAMPHGGVLDIETRHIRIDAQDMGTQEAPAPGRYIVLSVTDTGIGMDKATQAQIFDPFFTTKAVGRGTGLGLSTVYGIIKQHKGFIHVYTELGKGATFRIFLPVHSDCASEPEHAQQSIALPSGRETVLLVEDEPAVRRVSVKMLRGLGYQVLEAENGQRALEILRQRGGAVALLLTDVVMPEMDGKQLVEQATALYPGLKVICASGYPEAHLKLRNAWVTNHLLLQKPFILAELANSIRKALDAAG